MHQTSRETRQSLTRTALAVATLACSLWAGPANAAKVEGVPLDASFKAAERAASMVKVSDVARSTMKGVQRAAISSFQVEFVTKGAASASSYEIGRSGSVNTSVYYTLVGLTPSDYQSITEQLYVEFTRDLKGMGVDVLPAERVLAAAAYKKMAASGKVSPAETRTKDTWSSVYAPAGLGVYGVGSSSNAVGILAGFTALSDVSATMFSNTDLAKELDASLITVRLVVNFVDLKSSDSSWFGRSSGTASVNGSVAPSIAAGDNAMMGVHHASGVAANISMQAPLLMDAAAFREVKDTSSVAANVGLALLSAAIGGGGASAIEKEAVADPERYRLLVGGGLGTVREMFMDRMRASR